MCRMDIVLNELTATSTTPPVPETTPNSTLLANNTRSRPSLTTHTSDGEDNSGNTTLRNNSGWEAVTRQDIDESDSSDNSSDRISDEEVTAIRNRLHDANSNHYYALRGRAEPSHQRPDERSRAQQQPQQRRHRRQAGSTQIINICLRRTSGGEYVVDGDGGERAAGDDGDGDGVSNIVVDSVETIVLVNSRPVVWQVADRGGRSGHSASGSNGINCPDHIICPDRINCPGNISAPDSTEGDDLAVCEHAASSDRSVSQDGSNGDVVTDTSNIGDVGSDQSNQCNVVLPQLDATANDDATCATLPRSSASITAVQSRSEVTSTLSDVNDDKNTNAKKRKLSCDEKDSFCLDDAAAVMEKEEEEEMEEEEEGRSESESETENADCNNNENRGRRVKKARGTPPNEDLPV